jgi:RNA polymerase sigma factor (sigma-70 family)
MADESPRTTQLLLWLARIRDGDREAQNELIGAFLHRLERLARGMLRDYPRVKRFEQTGDVLQNAVVRLLRALPEVQLASTRQFYGLAAEQMRRELIDLVRHHYGPQGLGANLVGNGQGVGAAEPEDRGADPNDLEWWAAFQEAVGRLPDDEREVFNLLFYHGWKQEEAAEFLGVTVRTVQRRWQAAQLRLHDLIK